MNYTQRTNLELDEFALAFKRSFNERVERNVIVMRWYSGDNNYGTCNISFTNFSGYCLLAKCKSTSE